MPASPDAFPSGLVSCPWSVKIFFSIDTSWYWLQSCLLYSVLDYSVILRLSPLTTQAQSVVEYIFVKKHVRLRLGGGRKGRVMSFFHVRLKTVPVHIFAGFHWVD